MKIQPLSDLHLECSRQRWQIPGTDADVVVLAGDIGINGAGVEWAIEESQRLGKPIIYVPGNHEYYETEFHGMTAAMRTAAADTGVHFLVNEAIEIEGVRFLGCTLWTDYRACTECLESQAMMAAWMSITDHMAIRIAQENQQSELFTPEDALTLHQQALQWLAASLETKTEKTVVVTHHAPSPAAQPPQRPVSPISGAFWSDLECRMGNHIAAWIFGHTHHSVDTYVKGTRLVSNQRGYPRESCGFDPTFVIEV